jgi:hypothetical protein
MHLHSESAVAVNPHVQIDHRQHYRARGGNIRFSTRSAIRAASNNRGTAGRNRTKETPNNVGLGGGLSAEA